jgi:hypothetical protein
MKEDNMATVEVQQTVQRSERTATQRDLHSGVML